MPRERTTWNRDEVVKKANLSKQADPYLMNQDHVNKQPSHDKYTIGGPSDFAEDVHPSKGTWEAEYSGDQVKRNEIGMPEFRGDTFNHAEKTATEVEMVKKASLAVAVAKAMLPKTAGRSVVEEQASRLMKLADEDLVETYKALVAGEDEEGQEQAEEKQAGELPPALKEHMEEKKDKAEDKDQGDKKQAQDQGQQQAQDKQAQQDQGQQAQDEQAQDQAQQDQAQDKQAQFQQQGMQQLMAQFQQLQAQMQQLMAQGQQPQVVQAQDQQEGQDDKPAFLKDKEAQDQGQGQQDQGQDKQAAANRIQAAITAALAAGEDPAAAAMRAAQACMGQPMADDQLIDDMLAQQDPMMADVGIQMDTPSMDTGDVPMTAQDDALLAQIFASDEADQAQQAQSQQKQAAVRTASTRTVGTRPTQGVSRLGGLPSANKGESDLSSMWSTAPDVREVFGINR